MARFFERRTGPSFFYPEAMNPVRASTPISRWLGFHLARSQAALAASCSCLWDTAYPVRSRNRTTIMIRTKTPGKTHGVIRVECCTVGNGRLSASSRLLRRRVTSWPVRCGSRSTGSNAARALLTEHAPRSFSRVGASDHHHQPYMHRCRM